MNEKDIAVSKDFIRGRESKILNWDCEISPAATLSFSFYDATPYRIVIPEKVITIGWKWQHEKTIHGNTVADFDTYEAGTNIFDSLIKINELKLIEKFLEEYEQADLVVGHNVKKFDIRHLRTRAAFYGLHPINEPKTDDTLRMCRNMFALESNKLDYVCKYFGIEGKTENRYDDLIDGCLAGNKRAWNDMKKYCKQDVNIDDQLYQKISPWNRTGFNVNLISRKGQVCSECIKFGRLGNNYKKNGQMPTGKTILRQKYRCNIDGHQWVGEILGRAAKQEPVEKEIERVDQFNV